MATRNPVAKVQAPVSQMAIVATQVVQTGAPVLVDAVRMINVVTCTGVQQSVGLSMKQILLQNRMNMYPVRGRVVPVV